MAVFWSPSSQFSQSPRPGACSFPLPNGGFFPMGVNDPPWIKSWECFLQVLKRFAELWKLGNLVDKLGRWWLGRWWLNRGKYIILVRGKYTLTHLGGGNSNIFLFSPLGKWAILTNIFQMGWNHQLDKLGFISPHVGNLFLTSTDRVPKKIHD